MAYENLKIDLICQHCTDGSIRPIRFRVQDEEGIQREFNIKGYRETSEAGIISFDCNVVVNNIAKRVTIYTSHIANDGIWYIKMK